MANVNITIPDDLHKKIKVACAVQEITLKEYLIEKLRQHLKRKKR